MCVDRCGLPFVPPGPRRGEDVQWGSAAERGEEHPEERRQQADGPAAAAAGEDARSQKEKVSSSMIDEC